MGKRYVAIWFRHLMTDRMVIRTPELKDIPFVLAMPVRGRMVITAASIMAEQNGIYTGMVVADAKAILPALQVFDDREGWAGKLLHGLAEWCLCYTPYAAVDKPDGVLLDASGCPHLWGGELPYLKAIVTKLRSLGYDVRAAMADTIGTAWAVSRYGKLTPIIGSGKQLEALLDLPPVALRLETTVTQRLDKLGLYKISAFIKMPRRALRRRFGDALLNRLDQALGQAIETLEPVCPAEPYEERLPALEPIRTATGIEIALKQLLDSICERLTKEQKGLRSAVFIGYRIDGNRQQIEIGTSRPTRNVAHLFKLFETKIPGIEPALGIETFVLKAMIVEDYKPMQDAIWDHGKANDDVIIAELLDRIGVKLGMHTIHRYLPAEHHWPEWSVKQAGSLQEKAGEWTVDLPRPLQLLPRPEPIEVTVQLPDNPPMLFRHKGTLHRIVKADGPERIEQEWWLQQERQRDYYCVEDEDGRRYWLFRSGHYNNDEPRWYLHGYFE